MPCGHVGAAVRRVQPLQAQVYSAVWTLRHSPQCHPAVSLSPGVLLAGLRLSYGQVQLEGVVGEAVYFPALRPVARDIVRIIWFSGRQGTHIAEAKPQAREFNTNYLPSFSNRLAIHAGNLSLEMRELRLADQGPYRAVVDVASDPTNPRTFSYELSVRGRTTAGPPGGGGRPVGGEPVTAGGSRGRTTLAGGDGEVSGGGETQVSTPCHCALKGYLIAAVYGPLSIVVAIVHVKTRREKQ
ncbi:uncharacterized protein [Emydura macquarii macquarii]|uniref:uncharacterized protein n=1 Tax=Emydura macquarii macquarii TaxID=1129001 RepID=UPI00352A7F9B